MLQQKSVGARLTPEVMLLCLVTNVLLCLHNTVHASQKKKKIRDSLCIKYMNISFLQCNFTHWIEVAYYGIHFANREDIVIAVWYKVAEISTSRRCQWCSLPLPSLIMNHKQGQGLICMLLTECRSSLSCTLWYNNHDSKCMWFACCLSVAALHLYPHLMVNLTGTWYLLSNVYAPLSVLPHCCKKKIIATDILSDPCIWSGLA